jgi:glycosyltransferase involved in cell wall biosynthesis
MMSVAEELGMEPIFCGAMRDEGLSRNDQWGGWKVLRLGNPFPLLNGKRPLLYVRSVLNYNWHLFRHLLATKPSIVHASDIETMLASVAFRVLRKTYLIYNIHDNLAQRYEIPMVVAMVLNFIEGACARISDITLVPEDFRRTALPNWCQENVVVIRNTPKDGGYSLPRLDDKNRVRIFFGGWLDWGRGLRALISMAEQYPYIDLRVAGEGAPEIVDELRNNSSVRYLGFLEHEAVLEETRQCHFVPALYDPARTINRYAASNKLAEALSVGRPVIVNSEMLIASSLLPSDCIIAVEYARADTLATELHDLVRDRVAYLDASREARRIYEDRFAWGPVHDRMRRVLLRESTHQ